MINLSNKNKDKEKKGELKRDNKEPKEFKEYKEKVCV